MQNVLKMKRQRMLEEQQKRRKFQKRTPTTKHSFKKNKAEKETEDAYIEQVNIGIYDFYKNFDSILSIFRFEILIHIHNELPIG